MACHSHVSQAHIIAREATASPRTLLEPSPKRLCIPEMRSQLPGWLVILSAPSTTAIIFSSFHKFDFLPGLSTTYFGELSTVACNETLAAYNAAWNGHPIGAIPEDPTRTRSLPHYIETVTGVGVTVPTSEVGIADAIYLHQQCLLDAMPENIKATMQSASILLGLAPVLLQTAGASVHELGLLSAQRPLLAGLMALGTAAVFPSRIFGYREQSASALVKPPSLLPESLLQRLNASARLRNLVCLLQYVLAAVAVFNMIYTSLQLGIATVTTYDCTNSIMPLLWTLLPTVVHLPVSGIFWARRRNVKKRDDKKESSPARARKDVFRNELTLSVFQAPLSDEIFEPNLISSSFHLLASVMNFVHGFFGVLVFSSLIFVEIVDALVILLRFLASVLICRSIIAFEISGMRAARGKVDPRNTGKDESLTPASSEQT